MKRQSNIFILVAGIVASNFLAAQGNYVRTWEATGPDGNASNFNLTTTLQKARMNTVYYDGLGRPIQTVLKQGSLSSGAVPTDLVNINVYDNMGRESAKYLPFASTGNDGAYKTDALLQQGNFMQSQFGGQGESFFYGQVKFETSPLGRVKEVFAPGVNWSGTFTQPSENNRRSQKNKYWTNTAADDVKIWSVSTGSGPGGIAYGLQVSVTNNGNGTQTVNYSWTNPIPNATAVSLMYRVLPSGSWSSSTGSPVSPRSSTISTGTYEYAIQIYFNNGNPPQTVVYSTVPTTNYTVTGVYAAGQLHKNVLVDERGKQVIEFKDKDDRVLLKKVQISNGVEDDGTGRNYSGWLCTYYIYDELDQLRCVVQPKGVELLVSNSWNIAALNNDILNEQCFRYEYDTRRRMISKKVPGAGEVLMIYDARDRLVMTQDAKLRDASVKKWVYTQYDELNRIIATGLLYDPTNYNNPGYHRTSASLSTAYPNLASYSVEELTKTFYDNYDWLTSNSGQSFSSTRSVAEDSYLQPVSGVYPYPQAVTQGNATRGVITGTKTKVLATSVQLYGIVYYDEKGRFIQAQNQNYSGGTDISTTQYSWTGQVVLTIQKTVKSGGSAQTLTLLTQFNYDELGRATKIEKKIQSTLVNSGAMPSAWTTTAQNEYNKLGQVSRKKLGNKPSATAGTPLANLDYEYNVRGWLLSINKNYINGSNNDQYFGMELGYDKNASLGSFSAQYNGNISGTIWKSEGDQQKRKYDFSYDAGNRLSGADFNQYVSGSGVSAVFNKSANIDFSLSNMSYDANGNILSMSQKGLTFNSSPFIDQLSYTYQSNSNKLQLVTDLSNDNNSLLGDFKYDPAAKTGTDYTYDVNGNLLTDKNKKIDWIDYNHLNLPQGITIRDKSNVTNTIIYKYDAGGNKIQKEVYAGAVPPGKVTLYMGGGVFQDDILQFMGHEEGRIRFNPASPSTAASFAYDYFIKDHLGNVRMVLTEEQKQDVYPAATLENISYNGGTALSVEDDYYSIDVSKIVDQSAASGIPVYQNNNGNPPYNNNPYSNTTANSTKLYQLNASTNTISNKTGLGIVLKVMAGDQISIYGKSYHKQPVGGYTSGTNTIAVLDLINAFAGNTLVSSKGVTGSQIAGQPGFPTTINGLIGNQPAQTGSTPRASINWIVFDEQFKYVNGGFDMVGTAVNTNGTFKNHDLSTIPTIAIPKNGYIYVYCSNESQYNVFFDNLQVFHNKGPILEETHYYPFGGRLSGISSQSIGGIENKYEFVGKEKEEKEFIDGSGLEWLDFGARMYDPQIGRWFVVDALAEKFMSYTPYAYVGNSPINFFDPNGMDWANSQDEETARGLISQLNSRRDDLNKQLDKLNKKLEKAKNATYKSEEKKNEAITKIEGQINEATSMISDVTASINEITEMGTTTDMTFTFNDLGYNKGSGFLSTRKERDGKIVTVINYTYSNDPNSPNDLAANQIHELTHAFQFFKGVFTQTAAQVGTADFTYVATDPKLLKDITEVQAYQRQFSFDGPFKKNVNPFAPSSNRIYYPYQAENYSDINRNWLLNIRDVNGNYIYR